MPERTVRVLIQNSSASLTLVQSFNHLCTGAWTPGGWGPTASIAPGQNGAAQSESTMLLSGTEAYVKYDAINANKQKVGMIYVYWCNPYFGVTHARVVTAPDDVTPDCDFNSTGSTPFGNPNAKLPFSLQGGLLPGEDSGTNLNNVMNVVTLAGGAVLGPAGLAAGSVADFIALLGIAEHPELVVNVVDTPALPGSFGVTPASTLRPLTQATPALWEGHWFDASGKVTLDITGTTLQQLSAVLRDATATPPLTLTQTFGLGLDASVGSSARTTAGGAAAQQAAHPSAAGATSHPGHPTPTRHPTEPHPVQDEPTASDRASVGGIAQIAALERLRYGSAVAFLDDGVGLRLFGEFEGKTMIRTSLLYQRLGPAGRILVNLSLIRQIKIG